MTIKNPKITIGINDPFVLFAIYNSCFLYPAKRRYLTMIGLCYKIRTALHGSGDAEFNTSETNLIKQALKYANSHINDYLTSNNADSSKLSKKVALIYLKRASKEVGLNYSNKKE